MKRKVLFVIESLAGGGAEKVLTTIIKNLDQTKFDLTVLTVVKTGIYVEEVEKYCKVLAILPDYNQLKSPLARIQYKFKYQSVYHKNKKKLYRQVVKEKYDVEIAFVEGFATKFIASSNNPDSRKYAWLHTNMILNPHADCFYRNIQEEKEYYGKFDCVFAVSSEVKESFEEKFGHSCKVEIQYNAVDSKEIYKKALQEIEAIKESKNCYFVTAGRLEEQKGYRRLLKVVKSLRDYKDDFCLDILGDGTQRQELEEYILENHLEENVRLCGFQKNPYPYMKQADYFVCSSYTEGFSTVATESLLLAVPILTVDCAGMKELFGTFQCGEIVPNEEENLFEMLKKAVDGNYDREYLKKQTIERGSAFQLETRMEELERILDE